MGKVDDWQTDLWDGEQVSSFEVNNNTRRNKSALASSLSIDNYGPTSTNESEMTRSCSLSFFLGFLPLSIDDDDPNNTGRIVWTLGKSFPFSFVFYVF